MAICKNCKAQINDDAKFCYNCGSPVAPAVEEPPAPVAAEPVVEEAKAPEKPSSENVNTASFEEKASPKAAFSLSSIPKKYLKFGGIGVAAVAVIAIIAILISSLGGGAKVDGIMYLVDEEIWFDYLDEDKDPWEITENLLGSLDYLDKEDVYWIGSDLGYAITITKDNKVFYPDRVTESGASLYYRDLKNPEKEPVKIDSEVWAYSVNDAGNLVTYVKGDDDTLYQHNLEEKDKLATEIRDYYITEDGKKVAWITAEGDVYIKVGDEDKEKLASDINYIEYFSDDLTTLYYVKENSLYFQKYGEDRVKVASDYNYLVSVYPSGEVYYVKGDTTEVPLSDYVTDSMYSADASFVEPEYPEYPTMDMDYPWSWDFETYEEYEAAIEAYNARYDELMDAYDRAVDEYWDDYDLYMEKLDRDYIREELEYTTIELYDYSLYYYNGEESKEICSNVAYEDYFSYYGASDAAVIMFGVFSSSEVKKVDVADVYDIWEVESLVYEALYGEYEYKIAVKDSVTDLDLDMDKVSRFRINPNGTTIYYLDDMTSDWEYGDLYTIKIGKDGPEAPELYDSDVSYYTGLGEDTIAYFKDVNEEDIGDLYVNKKSVDYEVYIYSVTYHSETNTIYYGTDWNVDSETATLKYYKDDKPVKVADDIHDFYLLDDGRVLYLYDYSLNRYTGELHVFENGKSRKVADDVVAVIIPSESKYLFLD